MKIMKFGWTSVWSLEMIQNTAKIIVDSKSSWEEIVVVVSAMSWVTDTLIGVCDYVAKWDKENVVSILEVLRNKHTEVAHKICNWSCDIRFINQINSYISDLEDVIKWITILRQISDRARAKILYFWEILSSLIVSLAINQLWENSKNHFSRDVLMCTWKYMDSECDFDKSYEAVGIYFKNIDLTKEVPVFTWFWWWDQEHNVYLFDRWWSDYVATLLWRLLEVDSVEIWTDVDWVMSADPRVVEKPILWKELDYSVSAEFALVWAKILHPKTISPVQKIWVPVFIKNTFSPNAYWTKICNLDSRGIKWINIDDKQIVFTFVDPAMIWKSWYLTDVMKVFSDLKISIDTISTTETSFSLSIRKKYFSEELLKSLDHLKERFELEILEDISKISIVWDHIDDYSILSGLREVIMISKWAHPKSITVFVKKGDSKKLLQKLHQKLFKK